MKTQNIFIVILMLAFSTFAFAEDKPTATPVPDPQAPVPAATDAAKPVEPPAPEPPKFAQTISSVKEQLDAGITELSALMKQVGDEKIPLNRKLNELEDELVKLRKEFQDTSRVFDVHHLEQTNLGKQIEAHKAQAVYLTDLMNDYSRNFESRLHIAELQRYREPLAASHQAMETHTMPEQERYAAQVAVISASMDRLSGELKGVNFTGKAVDAGGMVRNGKFCLLGPAAIFKSDDGRNVGTVEQRLGSLEPSIIVFEKPEDVEAASKLIDTGTGFFPLDPSLGKAHIIASTHESLLEHVKKGGPVMIPIFAIAGAALLVALFKWAAMMLVRNPSQKRIRAMLDAVAKHDKPDAIQQAKKIGGPTGRMLYAGVEHLGTPRELIEEVMFEQILATRLKLNRLLPFIAITSSAAPLLGLLGTVTGIMNTFQLINVFGTGDVKTLSSGISEALITTEYGLYVAIPSLLIHAFLSRKAKGLIDKMEKAGIAMINQVSKSEHVEMEKAA